MRIYSQEMGWGSVDGKQLRKDEGPGRYGEPDSAGYLLKDLAKVIRDVRRTGHHTKEFGQISRGSDTKGRGFWLNRLSGILAESGISRPVKLGPSRLRGV